MTQNCTLEAGLMIPTDERDFPPFNTGYFISQGKKSSIEM